MLAFLVLVLAAHRLARLLTEDTITAPLRRKIFDRFPPHETSLSYVLTCAWCCTIWTAFGSVVVARLFPDVWSVVGLGLAVSAVAGLIFERQAEHGSI